MTRTPWRSRDGKKVLKAAFVARNILNVDAVTVCDEVTAEKVVREWLVEKYEAFISFSTIGVVWSVNGKTQIDLGNVTRIKIESVAACWGHDNDVATGLIAAGLAVLKGEKA